MVRGRSLRAALVATTTALVATLGVSVGTVAPAHADDGDLRGGPEQASAAQSDRTAATSRRAQRRAAARATPLAVTIETLTPSSIPARGDVQVAGTVTNTDSVPWVTVNVYSFIAEAPITTRAQLARAVQVDETAQVGERITTPGSYDTIDVIEPGETEPFSFAVDSDLLGANLPGVYWFGVHALGDRGEGRDLLADGRARTFMPLVPNRRTGNEALSVVIPLRRTLTYNDDGSLADLDDWILTLGVGGRLRSLVELGATSGDQTVSWAVDPALVDAVRQLAAGNPARSLEATIEEGEPDGEVEPGTSPSTEEGDETGEAEPSPTDEPAEEDADAEPEVDPTTAELPADLDTGTRTAAEVAREWLGRLRTAMDEGDEVLAVPYGDVDVSAAARQNHGGVYARGRKRSEGPLPAVGLPTAPAVAPPSGYLSPEAVGLVEPDSTILVTDKMFADPPAVASVSGRRLVVTAASATDGGPAPGDPRGAIAMRQRILSEAAVRFLKPARTPLVVLLPYDWVPPSTSSFFSGLAAEWVDLTSVERATSDVSPVVVAPKELKYPQRQVGFELDAANFAAADSLRASGQSLQDLLTLNNEVGRTVSDQSLASTSYSARSRPDSARASTDRSRTWIEERMGQVGVETPAAVTLSSINGSFPASITNDLDQPVTVSLSARSGDRQVDITSPEPLDIQAKGNATVLLDASTDEAGVHEVTIQVTDKAGRPIGASDQLSIRSARVSNVIWLFLAAGIGLLFGTIAFRLLRRVRAARR